MTEWPQRRLALELRFAIDHAVAVPADSPASLHRVREIIQSNPHGMRSRHVLHNLGAARLRWLEEQITGWPAGTAEGAE